MREMDDWRVEDDKELRVRRMRGEGKVEMREIEKDEEERKVRVGGDDERWRDGGIGRD